MRSNIMNLPPFSTQTWRKQSGQSMQAFRNELNNHVNSLVERGYNVEIEWINSNGELCEDERDLEVSTICRIVERKKELGKSDSISNGGNSDWITEQLAIAKGMRKSGGDER